MQLIYGKRLIKLASIAFCTTLVISIFSLGTKTAQGACTCICHDNNFVFNGMNDGPECNTACNTQMCPAVAGGKCIMDVSKSSCATVTPSPGGTPGSTVGCSSSGTKPGPNGVLYPCDPLNLSSSSGPKTWIQSAIGILLELVGAGAFLLALYGGAIIMFAQGDSKKVSEGKKIIVYAAIGIAIILLSYFMLNVIFSILQGAVRGSI